MFDFKYKKASSFHKSDIIHQSVFELIHSEDREEFKKHLSWNSKLPSDKANISLNELINNKSNFFSPNSIILSNHAKDTRLTISRENFFCQT